MTNNWKVDGRCQCSNKGCWEHLGDASCTNPASTRIRRIDLQDSSEMLFCEGCTEDAMESGLFEKWPERKK